MNSSLDVSTDKQNTPKHPLKSSTLKKTGTSVKKDSIELTRVKRESGEYHITNSWDQEALGPLNYMERKLLKSLQQREKERLRKVAEARHTYDSSKRQQMMAEEHEQMNTEFKRKQTYHNLVKKNMHDFTRRAKN